MTARAQAIAITLAIATPTLAQRPDEITSRLSAIRQNHPPQIRDARRLFDQARPFEGNLDQHTLLCRVSADSGRRYDGAARRGPVSRRYGAPDLNVTLRVHRTRGFIRGPEDRYSTTVSMPGVSLRRGQRVGIHLVDRDAFRNDTIGDAVAVYGGAMPIELPGNLANGECRVLDPAIAEQRLPGIVRRVDRELERAARIGVDIRSQDVPTPRQPLDQALYHLYDGAALVGWAHAEVGNRRERVAEIDRAWTDAFRRAVDEVADAAPDPGVPVAFSNGTWEVRATEVDCSGVQRFGRAVDARDPRACAVRLEVATSRPGRFRPRVRAFGDESVVRAELRVRERNAAYERYSGQRLESGELHVLWVVTDASPRVLRLSVADERVFVRVR